MWMAGGGIKGGQAVGATDEIGLHAVENRCHFRDIHTTLLHQLGLEQDRLSFLHMGPQRAPHASPRARHQRDRVSFGCSWGKRAGVPPDVPLSLTRDAVVHEK